MNIRLRLPLRPFVLDVELATDERAVAIFGPSGAGKSSLIECLAGIRRGASGSIRIDGETWFDSAAGTRVDPRHRRVGFVPQQGLLFPHLDVEANLRYAPGHTNAELDRVVAELGLATLLRRMPETLSGGERQRVALGRALCASPRVLLLDEPLASLDYDARHELLHHLVTLRRTRDVRIFFVTHEPEQVLALCDVVVHLRNGRIEQTTSPSRFFERSGDRWRWPA